MNAEEIINLYKDEDGFVLDIKNLIQFLKEHEEIDRKERNAIIEKIIFWNLSIDKKYRELLSDRKETVIKEEKVEQTPTFIESSEKEESSLIDVSSYINAIKACDDDDFLTELLPSEYDTNYDSIIGSIVLYFYREISLANKMLLEETDKDGIDYLKSVIKRDKEIIRIIDEYTKEETLEVQEDLEEQKTNKLVFLRKPTSNSLYIDDDIDDIAIEDDVLPILNDIITGRITKEKRFHSSNLKGISAIRRRDSRIIFVRLDNDIILILGILVKRFQNTQVYRDMLESRIKAFRVQKEQLKDSITSEDFIEDNNSIKERIIDSLKARKKN